MDMSSQDSGERVEGVLHYLGTADVNERASVQPGWPGGSAPYTVSIRDARPLAGGLSLDRQGFLLMRRETAVTNFYDADEVRAVYYPEIERLIEQATGAVKVAVFAHDVRCGPKAGINGVREPIVAVHNDYTLRSGPQHVQELLSADEAAIRLKRRYAELNVWRPIRGPVQDMPLAVCDAGSIARRDFVPVELKHEVYMLTYNRAHRWYYFPLMRADEVMLIKGFDSMEDGRARFTAHAAFRDPRGPAGAPPRESIEARALVFF